MADFRFIVLPTERRLVLECADKLGLRIIPDVELNEYRTEKPFTGLEPRLLEQSRFYLAGEYTNRPIYRHNNNGLIFDRVGGPVLSLTIPPSFGTVSDYRVLVSSHLHCRSRYWENDLVGDFEAPPELNTAYRELVKYLKETLLRKCVGVETRWMTQRAIDDFKAGTFRLRGKRDYDWQMFTKPS